MTRPMWILAIIVIILAYLTACLILWQCIDRPYDRPEPISVKVINAALARHGNVTLITVPGGLYFERGGRICWIVRRGGNDQRAAD